MAEHIQNKRNILQSTISNALSWPENLVILTEIVLPGSNWQYRQVSNISRALVGNKIVDHSDVVGASPVGAAPTTSSFST